MRFGTKWQWNCDFLVSQSRENLLYMESKTFFVISQVRFATYRAAVLASRSGGEGSAAEVIMVDCLTKMFTCFLLVLRWRSTCRVWLKHNIRQRTRRPPFLERLTGNQLEGMLAAESRTPGVRIFAEANICRKPIGGPQDLPYRSQYIGGQLGPNRPHKETAYRIPIGIHYATSKVNLQCTKTTSTS